MKKPSLYSCVLIIVFAVSLVMASFAFSFADDLPSFSFSYGSGSYPTFSPSENSRQYWLLAFGSDSFVGHTVSYDFTLSSSSECWWVNSHMFTDSPSGNFSSGTYSVSITVSSSAFTTIFNLTSQSSFSVTLSNFKIDGDYVFPGDIPIVVHDISITVPYGYVAEFIGMESGDVISASSSDLPASGIGNRWTTYQYYTVSSSRITSFQVGSTNGGVLVDWQKVDPGFLNITKKGSWSHSFIQSVGYFYFVNPLSVEYDSSTPLGARNESSTVILTYPSNMTCKVRSLSYDWSTGIASITDDSQSYDVDPNTGSLIDSDGNPVTPPSGGNDSSTIWGDGSSEADGVIKQLVSLITNLFNRGANAISTLVSNGQGFFNTLTGLYSWLPADIVSVINSALILFIIIGTLKLLL